MQAAQAALATAQEALRASKAEAASRLASVKELQEKLTAQPDDAAKKQVQSLPAPWHMQHKPQAGCLTATRREMREMRSRCLSTARQGISAANAALWPAVQPRHAC